VFCGKPHLISKVLEDKAKNPIFRRTAMYGSH
jgi:hypothetical protein